MKDDTWKFQEYYIDHVPKDKFLGGSDLNVKVVFHTSLPLHLHSIALKWDKQGLECSMNEWGTDMNRHFKFVAEITASWSGQRTPFMTWEEKLLVNFFHWMNHYLYKQARWTGKGTGLLRNNGIWDSWISHEPKHKEDPVALLNLVSGKFISFHVCHPQNATSFNQKNKSM